MFKKYLIIKISVTHVTNVRKPKLKKVGKPRKQSSKKKKRRFNWMKKVVLLKRIFRVMNFIRKEDYEPEILCEAYTFMMNELTTVFNFVSEYIFDFVNILKFIFSLFLG